MPACDDAAIRPGHLAHGRAPARARPRGRLASRRARTRRPDDRHRRDVWRRERRGDRRRGDRRPPRRCLSGEQVLSAPRGREDDAGGLQAESRRGWAWIGSTATCCTGGVACRSRKRWRRSSASCSRAASCAGACRTSTSTTWTSCARSPAAIAARRTRCSTTSAIARRSGSSWTRVAHAARRSWPIRRWGRADCCAIGASVRLQRRSALTPAQLALAFVLSHEGVVAIPKASDEAHVRENFAAGVDPAGRGDPGPHRRGVPASDRPVSLSIA